MPETRMTRKDFQDLAVERLDDAKVLHEHGRFSAAHYLAGYVVECALKACIAKQTRAEEFPPKERVVKKYYTHDLAGLMAGAELGGELEDQIEKDKESAKRWRLVKQWNENQRYAHHKEIEAKELIEAIEHPDHGVLPWLRNFW